MNCVELEFTKWSSEQCFPISGVTRNHRRKLVKISGGGSRHEDHRRQKEFGGTMASAEHEPITGVWQSPQQGPGAEPLVRGLGGETPLKLKAFWSLDVQRSRQI